MALVWQYIDSYLVRHYGRKSDANEANALTTIICYKQSDIVGYVHFYLEDNVPESTLQSQGTDLIMVRLPISRANEVLDTIRQEKPVSIAVDTDKKVGWVASGAEPVGEEEGV